MKDIINPRGAGRKPPPIPTKSRNFRLTEVEFAALRAAGDGDDATLGLRRLIHDEPGVRQAIREAMDRNRGKPSPNDSIPLSSTNFSCEK